MTLKENFLEKKANGLLFWYVYKAEILIVPLKTPSAFQVYNWKSKFKNQKKVFYVAPASELTCVTPYFWEDRPSADYHLRHT